MNFLRNNIAALFLAFGVVGALSITTVAIVQVATGQVQPDIFEVSQL